MCGNSEAVWPSLPMPSRTIAGGLAASRLASATAASMLRPGRVSDSKRASAACPRNRCSRTSDALLSGSSGSSQRSSTRAMSTRDQSSGACESAWNTGAGVVPPDTSRRARGRASSSRRSAAVTETAAAQAHWSSLPWSWNATGQASPAGDLRTWVMSFLPRYRLPAPRRPAGPAADAGPRGSAPAPSPARSDPCLRSAGGSRSAAAREAAPGPGRR